MTTPMSTDPNVVSSSNIANIANTAANVVANVTNPATTSANPNAYANIVNAAVKANPEVALVNTFEPIVEKIILAIVILILVILFGVGITYLMKANYTSGIPCFLIGFGGLAGLAFWKLYPMIVQGKGEKNGGEEESFYDGSPVRDCTGADEDDLEELPEEEHKEHHKEHHKKRHHAHETECEPGEIFTGDIDHIEIKHEGACEGSHEADILQSLEDLLVALKSGSDDEKLQKILNSLSELDTKSSASTAAIIKILDELDDETTVNASFNALDAKGKKDVIEIMDKIKEISGKIDEGSAEIIKKINKLKADMKVEP